MGVHNVVVRPRNWDEYGQKIPFSPPSDPIQRLFQEPPAKSKFLAAAASHT